MYAVIRTGGKQYRVTTGDVLRVEKMAAEEGGTVEFDEVLMVGEGKDVVIGKPLVSGGLVKGKVRALGRADKVEIIKFKRRKHHMKRQGHRQPYVEVEITDISSGKGGSATAKPKAEAAPKAAPAKKAAESKPAAAKKPAASKTASSTPAKKTASTAKSATAGKTATAKKPAAKKPAAKKASTASAGKTTAKKTASTAKKPAAKKSTRGDDK